MTPFSRADHAPRFRPFRPRINWNSWPKVGAPFPPPLATPEDDPVHLIGRGVERRIIGEALTSESPELVAVRGRRRVGKTFLIRQGRTPSGKQWI